MDYNMNYLEQTTQLLKSLESESILTPENTPSAEQKKFYLKLQALREIIPTILPKTIPAPGMTTSVVLTLLKVGACQELTQRVALEYFLRFKKANFSIIFTVNVNDMIHSNHCFGLVGGAVAKDELFIGRGNAPCTIPSKDHYIPLKQFLSQQKKNAVIIDPLLNFTCDVHSSCEPLLEYCKKYNIEYITGIREFSQLAADNAETINSNAKFLSEKLNKQNNKSDQDAYLTVTIEKFKLDPNKKHDKAIREQALRRAAMCGTTQDLSILLSSNIDINSQDTNISKKNTALHIALLYKKIENAKFLMNRGAKLDILNADNLTVKDLIEQNNLTLVFQQGA